MQVLLHGTRLPHLSRLPLVSSSRLKGSILSGGMSPTILSDGPPPPCRGSLLGIRLAFLYKRRFGHQLVLLVRDQSGGPRGRAWVCEAPRAAFSQEQRQTRPPPQEQIFLT